MKLGKEIKLDLLDNYKTKIGTVNNKESKSLYLNFSAWGELLENEERNYNTFLSAVLLGLASFWGCFSFSVIFSSSFRIIIIIFPEQPYPVD